MTDEDLFLLGVRAAPDDDLPRLVFADWYEEHGQPARAEFIRIQCRLAALPLWYHEREALEAREADLWRRHAGRWNAEAHRRLAGTPLKGRVRARAHRGGLIRGWRYRRGFIDAVIVTGRAWVEHAESIRQIGPISELRLSDRAGTAIADIARVEHTAGLRGLWLTGQNLSTADWESLARVPWTRLSRLRVIGPQVFGGNIPLTLLGLPPVRGLTELELTKVPVTALFSLWNAPSAQNLIRLDLSFSSPARAFFGSTGFQAWAQSANLPRLTRLGLSGLGFLPSALTRLAAARWFPQLEVLGVRGTDIGLNDLMNLGQLPAAANLRVLDVDPPLRNQNILARLAETPFLNQVTFMPGTPRNRHRSTRMLTPERE